MTDKMYILLKFGATDQKGKTLTGTAYATPTSADKVAAPRRALGTQEDSGTKIKLETGSLAVF